MAEHVILMDRAPHGFASASNRCGPSVAPPVLMTLTIADPRPVVDLETRIKARRDQIIRTLRELKTQTGIEAGQTRDRLRAKLSELGHIIKESVVDGWASIGDIGKRRLDRWLAS